MIPLKTIQDLEFEKVLLELQKECCTTLGFQKIKQIKPFTAAKKLLIELNYVNEYVASLEAENKIPNHNFIAITKELQLLTIENSFLEVKSLQNIALLTQTTTSLITFFKKFNAYYPDLYNYSTTIEYTNEITAKINTIIDRFGEIKDHATPKLHSIRKEIKKIKSVLNESFTKALNYYNTQDYLDDIRESVIENKRVLAVKAMHRRKVNGVTLGSSKTGSIIFIEPEATVKFSRELQTLLAEEKEECIKILKETTRFIQPFSLLLQSNQDYLTHIDVVAAKAKYAKKINAILPEITKERSLYLRDAYHPILYSTNADKGEKTYPQNIRLNTENRIIVISGPNAGGKSITLKTVGLLQLMLQSGLLIPVHERSKVCLFKTILTDIGDNQSIENHLSTYSYRLKQMRKFLNKVTKNTLFLIDEFGTGSDPELGGALAETFLEEFYNREAYGIITTHYTNLKLLANELPHMQNASMQFNEQSLEPNYKLVSGQAGSSFTFEVAQKNGIPYRLINKAKKKIERGKVRFDATIAKLQKERNKLAKTGVSLKQEEKKKQEETSKLEAINTKIQKKLESYQELFDSNQRLLYLGQKVDKLAIEYLNNKQKKQLQNELFKLVQIENSKRKKQTAKQVKIEKNKQEELVKEVTKKVAIIRKKKKAAKAKQTAIPKPKPILKIGDRVRLPEGKAIGTIDAIKKNKAIVNYGIFKTSVAIETLEFVE